MLTRVVAMIGRRTASSLLVKRYPDFAEWVAGVQSQDAGQARRKGDARRRWLHRSELTYDEL